MDKIRLHLFPVGTSTIIKKFLMLYGTTIRFENHGKSLGFIVTKMKCISPYPCFTDIDDIKIVKTHDFTEIFIAIEHHM